MKVLHLISSFKRGGRERQLVTIVSNTLNGPIFPEIVYFNDSSNTYLKEYNLEKEATKLNSTNFFSRFIELHFIIKKRKPDIVFTWGLLESILALLIMPFHSYKFINGSVRHGIRSNKFSHYFRTFLLHLSPYVIANSLAGLKANKLKKGYILYNGIGKKFMTEFDSEQKQHYRKKLLKTRTDQTILVSVANLVPYKDYFSVLNSLKSLDENGYSFYYLILGDGPLKEDIIQTISDYNLKDKVKLLGNVENVNDYLKVSDIFIHSSKGEGCSNAILEAMAAGLPIIATDVGGTQELVSDNAFLFKYKDEKSLSNELMRLIKNNKLRNKMGIRSLEIIKERFLINEMINNYSQIIKDVLND